MSWSEVTVLSAREEFVRLALTPNANISQLCSRFKISRKTGYKYIGRFMREGLEGLEDRSRRPNSSPNRTDEGVERKVIDMRKQHPAWGGRKIRRRLQDLGQDEIPSPNTITEILRRNDMLEESECVKHKPYKRFQREAPNDLWQMDFKGDFATDNGPCHPLSVLDDYSRFAIALKACRDQRTQTVKNALVEAFERYGLPSWMLMDNGSPWSGGPSYPFTVLTVWLIRLGISVTHGRAYHPQTQGKDERFHRTFKAEVLSYQRFEAPEYCQGPFDEWRDVYNLERPHEALELSTPASKYQVSKRAYQAELPPIEYGPADTVRKVQQGGVIHFTGREFKVGKAFAGYPVALRPTNQDGVFDVFFCHQKVVHIDLANPRDGDTKV